MTEGLPDSSTAQLFDAGNYAASAMTGSQQDWRTFAAHGLVGNTRSAVQGLARFDDPEARFYLAVARWIDGDEAAAVQELEKVQTPHAQNLLRLIRQPKINILAQLRWDRMAQWDLLTAASGDKKFAIRNVSYHPNDLPNRPYADVHSFYDRDNPPDFYVCAMVEWHALPPNLQELPCPILGQTADYDLHLQTVHPWLQLFDELVVTDPTEWQDVSRLVDAPVSTFPKTFGIPENLPRLERHSRPLDLFLSGSLLHPYHPDKARLFHQLLHAPGITSKLINGFTAVDEYSRLLNDSKACFTYVRHSGATPSRGIEALSMGCAAIVQRGCVLELYLGQDEGLLTYDYDAGDLVPTIRRVLDQWPEYEQRALRGAKIVRREFSMGKVASQYLRFLTFLAAKPRGERKTQPAGSLIQKRGILQKGLLLGSPEVYQRQLQANRARWEPQLENATTPNILIDLAREQVLEYSAAVVDVNGKPADGALLDNALSLYRSGLDRYPRSLALRFNFIRTALHFGQPSDVLEALGLARRTLEQPQSHWLMDPMEDVFPWDFFPTHFDYRGYFDAITGQVMGQPATGPLTVELIQASLHNYLAHYEGALAHQKKAVALNPAFPHYKMRLAVQLARQGRPEDFAEAGLLLVELGHDSILFEQAIRLLQHLHEKGLVSCPQIEELQAALQRANKNMDTLEGTGPDGLQPTSAEAPPPPPARVTGKVTVHKRRKAATAAKVSVVLLDWSCRESFHCFKWLSEQTVPRDQYELIWVELYDRVAPEVMRRADVVLTCNQQGMYHKHEGYNEALLLASGKVVTVCDSDAVFPPNYIESIIKEFGLDSQEEPTPKVLLHHEFRSPVTYPAQLSGVGQLPGLQWKPLWPNAGASVSVAVRDAIRFGGFDEHPAYRGYLCGPYELAWRLVNAGLPEEWHNMVSLYHFAHPHASQTANEPGWNEMVFPHIDYHAGLAVEAFSTGRVLPLQPHPEIQKRRMESRRIGTQFEVKYSRMLGSTQLAQVTALLQGHRGSDATDSATAPGAAAARLAAIPAVQAPPPVSVYQGSDRYLVSALVPTYNHERFMRGLLQDLEAQTIANRLEIVIVDTASPTNERAIVQEFQKRYDNIVYVRVSHKENSHEAINRCLRMARGKYVTLACTDDRHRRDAYERMVAVLDSRPDVALVYANSHLTTKENETLDAHKPQMIIKCRDFDPLTLIRNCFVGPQPMWRRSLHDRYGYLDETLEKAADWDMWLRFAEGETFLHIDELLGLYLDSPTSSEHINPELSRREAVTVHQRYLHRVPALLKKQEMAQSNAPSESGVLVLVPRGAVATNNLERCVQQIRDSGRRLDDFKCTVVKLKAEDPDNSLGVEVSPGTATALDALQRATATEARFVALVSPDVTVSPDWLERMIAVAKSAPEIAAVGPVARIAPVPQRVTGPKAAPGERAGGHSRASQETPWDEVDYLGGFCLLLKIQAVQQVGGVPKDLPLAEALWQLYGRLRAAGFKLARAREIYVEHERMTEEEGSRYDELASAQQATNEALAPGSSALQAGDLEGAVREFSLAAKRFPDTADIHAALGATLMALERYEEAVAALRRSAELAPQAAPLHDQLGVALFRAGDLRGAESEFLRARDLDPRDMQCRLNLADLHWSQRRYDEATAVIRDALKLDPNHPDAISTFGFLCLDLGDVDGAKMAAERLRTVAPEHSDIDTLQRGISGLRQDGTQPDLGAALDATSQLLRDGSAALDRGDLDAAVVEFSRLVQEMPGLAAAHTALGSTLMALERVDEAIPSLHRAAELAPTAPALHNQLGVALYQTNDLEGAEAAFARAREADPSDIGTLLNLIDLYRTQNRYVEATELVKEALRLNPNHGDVLISFAILSLELGDLEGAEMALARLLATNPDHPEADALRQAIEGARGVTLPEEAGVAR